MVRFMRFGGAWGVAFFKGAIVGRLASVRRPPDKKTPAGDAGERLSNAWFALPVHAAESNGLLHGLTGNVCDIAAADAEVAEFAVAHAAEFIDGLTILAPVVERTGEVHGRFLCNLLAGVVC
jgi:hypothetical protein